MPKLTEEAKTAIAEGSPALIATASNSGKPNVSLKGSFCILDDETVAFADVHSPRTMANIAENPQISVYCLNRETNKGCRIWGTGTVLDSGPVFDQVAAPLIQASMTVNHVVSIAVEEFEVS